MNSVVTLSQRSARYIDLARKVALLSTSRMKHGAVIVRGGNILSIACNRLVTHPTSLKWASFPGKITTIHAEQRALILAQGTIEGAVLYSVRLNGNLISKPCPMCHALMVDAGIHSVIYYDGVEYIRERL